MIGVMLIESSTTSPMPDPKQCYFEPSVVNIVVAVFLILGTMCSYIPQYIAIVKAKSSDGINFIMLAIAVTSGFLTAINSGILKWEYVVCCLDLSSSQCIKNNLATEQLISALLCSLVLYILFVVYFRTQPYYHETLESRIRGKRVSIIVFITAIVLSIILAIVCGVLYYDVHLRGTILASIAQALGIISSILMIVQWAPQIYTTYKMRSPGNLSVLMLLLQMPGALLVMFFQAILNSADVTTWAPYAFLFVEQLILVVMCSIFNIQEKRNNNQQSSEKQRLLVEVETVSNYNA